MGEALNKPPEQEGQLRETITPVEAPGEYLQRERLVLHSDLKGIQDLNSLAEHVVNDPEADPAAANQANSQLETLDGQAQQTVAETEDFIEQWKKRQKLVREQENQEAKALETKVFDSFKDDPFVVQAEKEILQATNTDRRVTENQRGFGPDRHVNEWHRVNYVEESNRWGNFVTRFPEKAAAYAEQGHQGIARALAQQSKRAEQPAFSYGDYIRERFPKVYARENQTATVVKAGADNTEPDITLSDSKPDNLDDVDITLGEEHVIDGIDITLNPAEVAQRFSEIPAIPNNEVEITLSPDNQREKTDPQAIKQAISGRMISQIRSRQRLFPGMSPESSGLNSQEQRQRREQLRQELRRLETSQLPSTVSGMRYRSERPLGNHFKQEQGFSCTLASTLNTLEALGVRGNLTEEDLARAIGENGSTEAIGVAKTLDYLKDQGLDVKEIRSISEIMSELTDGKVVMMTVPGDINHRVVISAYEIRDDKIFFLWNDPLKGYAHWTSMDAVAKRLVYDPDMVYMCESVGKENLDDIDIDIK